MGMPKLFQWLLAVGLFMGVWFVHVTGYVQTNLRKEYKEIIVVLPLYLLISFACFSLAVVGYRVAKFNDCKDAAKEIKQQIEEARRDLEMKGYKFATDWK